MFPGWDWTINCTVPYWEIWWRTFSKYDKNCDLWNLCLVEMCEIKEASNLNLALMKAVPARTRRWTWRQNCLNFSILFFMDWFQKTLIVLHIFTGVITQVKLENSGNILCKLLHTFSSRYPMTKNPFPPNICSCMATELLSSSSRKAMRVAL